MTLTLSILAFFRVQSFTLTLNVYLSLSSSFYDCVCVCVLSSFIVIAFALPSNSCLRSVVCWCDVRHDVFCEEYFDFWLSSTQVNRIKQRIEDSRNWVNKKIEQYRDGSKSLSRKQQTKKKHRKENHKELIQFKKPRERSGFSSVSWRNSICSIIHVFVIAIYRFLLHIFFLQTFWPRIRMAPTPR